MFAISTWVWRWGSFAREVRWRKAAATSGRGLQVRHRLAHRLVVRVLDHPVEGAAAGRHLVAEGPEQADALGRLEAGVDAGHPLAGPRRRHQLALTVRRAAGQGGEQGRVLDPAPQAQHGGATAEPLARHLAALRVVPAGAGAHRTEVVVLAPAADLGQAQHAERSAFRAAVSARLALASLRPVRSRTTRQVAPGFALTRSSTVALTLSFPL